MLDLHAQQIRLEQKMFDEGARIWAANQARNIEQGSASATAWNRRLTSVLVLPLAEGIDAYLESLKGKRGARSKGAHILEVVDTKVAAFIAIKSLFDLTGSHTGDLHVRTLCVRIGQRIEDNIRFTRLADAAPGYMARVQTSLKKAFSHQYKHQSATMAAAERALHQRSDYAFDLSAWVPWSDDDQLHVGLLISDIMHRVLTIDGAPFVEIERSVGRGQGAPVLVHLSQATIDWCEAYKDEVGKLFPAFAPCVIPPRDWVSPFEGGYHSPEVSSRLTLLKSGRIKHVKRLTKQQMPAVYRCVNYLQRTAWRVNTDLLAALELVMNSNRQGKALPDRQAAVMPDCPVDPELSDLKGAALLAILTEAEANKFKAWKADVRDMHLAERVRRCKILKSNSVRQQAQEYSAYDRIYFVWNLDSRGRVYCASSRLSPQGDDLSKALIELADAAPLGVHGKKWLAVHGTNVWGGKVAGFDKKSDKLSIADRIRAVQVMQEDILDYAADPVTFTGWMDADKPWNFLAWCIEWARLLRWESNALDTADFMSGIPIALDGSCSGIQHYSAMLRDEMGAQYVNLRVTDTQQDIYGEVAERTIKELRRIAKGEASCAAASLEGADQRPIAESWLGYGIDRNFCKKPVMTLPYGSTQLTAREGVRDMLAEAIFKARESAKRDGLPYIPPHPFDPKADLDFYLHSVTLVTSTMWAQIGEVVPAARAAMRFIRQVAGVVAKSNSPLTWQTPTGFIVEQALWVNEEERIDTALLGRISITLSRDTRIIDEEAMKTAAAPNFVHSYDASHLVFVCNAAEDAGIKGLACIHDSFGAPAGRTEEMYHLLRETFVELYEGTDPLYNLKCDAEAIASCVIEEEPPARGNLDLREIMQSPYAFI